MLIGEGFIAHTAFNATIANVGGSLVGRAFKCLVSGSGITGAPAAAGAGRFTITLDEPCNIVDCDVSLTIGGAGTLPGVATNGMTAQVIHVNDTLKEIDLYTVAAAGGVLTGLLISGTVTFVNASFRRVDPA